MHDIIKCLNYEMFREFGMVPDPYKIETIKNVDTSIIVNPLYVAHPEDLCIFAYMMNERPWDVLCRDAYAKRGKKKYNNSLGKRFDHAWVDKDVAKLFESEEIQDRICDIAAISGQNPYRVSEAFRYIALHL